MGTSGSNACTSYPYTLSSYPSLSEPRTIITLDFISGDTTFRELFTRNIRASMQGARSRIDEVLTRAQSCLQGDLPSAGQLRIALDNLCDALPLQTSNRELMVSPQASWPKGLLERAWELFAAGFYLNFQMVPDSAKNDIAHFFSDSGDGFLTKAGNLTFKNYFELPRSAYSQADLDLLYRGRRLGVLMCHEEFASAENKPGYCWNGVTCVATTDSLICTGNTGSSDPC